MDIPKIGFGTWQLTGDTCIESVKTALAVGYRHIDTAEIYQNEEEVGTAIKQSGIPRDQLWITSKAWQNELTYDRVIKACEISLRKLQTDYIDLYLLHWPDKYLNMEEIFKAFKDLKDQGKIKYFGISNCTPHHIKDFKEITNKLNLPIYTNQVEFHPLFYQKELLEFCNQNNIKITAYSPLAQGDVFKNETLKEIANKYNKNPGQIALKWMIQKEIIVIPRSSKEDHIKNNFEIDFELSEEDINKIDSIKIHERLIEPGFAEFDY